MPSLLTETHFFIGATVLLVGSGLAHLLSPRWRVAEQCLTVLALLCLVSGLAFSAISRSSWPLTAVGEVILASASAAVLWHLVCRSCRKSRLEDPGFYVTSAGLLTWGLAQRSGAQIVSVSSLLQPAWVFTTRLMLALACGAFADAGSLALFRLVAAKQPDGRADVDCGEVIGCYAVLLGFPLLTLSLLLTALGGQYAEGIYWSWSVAESWQLLTWLSHAVLWCGYVLLGWRSRRLRILASLGLILTTLMLNAMVNVA